MAGIALASGFNRTSANPLDLYDVVADVTARNAIVSGVRYQGMKVYVLSVTKTYQLQSGILDVNWVDISSGLATYYLRSNANGLTAHAGGGQGSALQIGAELNRYSTVATAGDSAKLPAGVAGMEIFVHNDGAADMNVYPATGESIDGLGVNGAYSVISLKNASFKCMATGVWRSQASGVLATGRSAIGSAAQSIAVIFGTALANTNYSISWSIENTTDTTPTFLEGYISAKSTTGFTISFNALTDTTNYVLGWSVMS